MDVNWYLTVALIPFSQATSIYGVLTLCQALDLHSLIIYEVEQVITCFMAIRASALSSVKYPLQCPSGGLLSLLNIQPHLQDDQRAPLATICSEVQEIRAGQHGFTAPFSEEIRE